MINPEQINRNVKRQTSPHYVYLDFLRFAAAIMVMLYHYSTANYVSEHWQIGTKAAIGTNLADYRPLMPYFSTGWIGVDIFFVISGFVIALSAEGRDVKNFVQSRVLRLYPVIVIGTIIAMTVSLLYSQTNWETILLLSFKQIVIFPKGEWIDGVFWTLVVEVAFYVAITLIIYLGMYNKIETIVTCWSLMTLAISLITLLSYLSDVSELHLIYRFGVSYFSRIILVSTGPYFCVGILVYIVARSGLSLKRAVLLAGSAAACLINIYLASSDDEFIQKGYATAFVPMIIWSFAVIGIAFSAWSGISSPGGARVRTIARWVGLMTFPLYLIHNSLGAYLLGLIIKAGVPIYPAFCIAVVVVIIVSFVISRSLEPLLRGAIRNHVFPGVDRIRMRVAHIVSVR